MRCLLCLGWSLSHVCTKCQRTFLSPEPQKRELFKDFFVYSFYPYSQIKELLLTKHTYLGAYIYTILAKNSFAHFAKAFSAKVLAVPVDDRVGKRGFSHTAILAKSLKSGLVTPRYRTLLAKNRVHYAAKSLRYRLAHPRGFSYTGARGDIILVDDIVTTGSTLKEAYSVCKSFGANPVMALVLADARE